MVDRAGDGVILGTYVVRMGWMTLEGDRHHIENVIMDLFSVQDLRLVICRLPHGKDVLNSIPEHLSPRGFVHEVCEALSRRSLLGKELFGLLRSERPASAAVIDDLARRFAERASDKGAWAVPAGFHGLAEIRKFPVAWRRSRAPFGELHDEGSIMDRRLHREVLDDLREYGLALVGGPVGSGKTTMAWEVGQRVEGGEPSSGLPPMPFLYGPAGCDLAGLRALLSEGTAVMVALDDIHLHGSEIANFLREWRAVAEASEPEAPGMRLLLISQTTYADGGGPREEVQEVLHEQPPHRSHSDEEEVFAFVEHFRQRYGKPPLAGDAVRALRRSCHSSPGLLVHAAWLASEDERALSPQETGNRLLSLIVERFQETVLPVERAGFRAAAIDVALLDYFHLRIDPRLLPSSVADTLARVGWLVEVPGEPGVFQMYNHAVAELAYEHADAIVSGNPTDSARLAERLQSYLVGNPHYDDVLMGVRLRGHHALLKLLVHPQVRVLAEQMRRDTGAGSVQRIARTLDCMYAADGRRAVDSAVGQLLDGRRSAPADSDAAALQAIIRQGGDFPPFVNRISGRRVPAPV